MEYPNIKVEADDITLTEYSLFGELPISDKSGIIIKTMGHLKASVGCTMQLSTCKRGILQLVLDQYKQREIVALKKKSQSDSLKAHVYCSEASISVRRKILTGASKAEKVRQKIAVNECLQTNIQALTALFMMSWEMVREQAQIWGVGLYFAYRKVKFPKLTDIENATFSDISPEELQAIGIARTMLDQATIRPESEEPADCKTHSKKECRFVKRTERN